MFQRLSQLRSNTTMTFFDLETTGLDVKTSRIIQFSSKSFIVDEDTTLPSTKEYDDGQVVELNHIINPKIKVPKEILELTGLSKEQIVNSKPLEDVADDLRNTMLNTQYICSYNGLKYDLPLLKYELARIYKPLNYKVSHHELNTHMLFIDVFDIVRNELKGRVHAWCKRNDLPANLKLETVYKFIKYKFAELQGELLDLNTLDGDFHNSQFDVDATILVFNGLVSIFKIDVNNYCKTFYNVDGYKLSINDKDGVITKQGLYKDKTLSEILDDKNGRQWLKIQNKYKKLTLDEKLIELCES